MKSYLIPATDHKAEQVIKRNQFICYLAHCSDKASARSFVKRIQEQHNDANHNCWTYIVGALDSQISWAINDDGESKGCARRPMFIVLQHSGLSEICAVVARYFGGIKLGTGGMARAYSSSVSLALESLSSTTKHHYKNLTITLPYSLHQQLEKFLIDNQAIILTSE